MADPRVPYPVRAPHYPTASSSHDDAARKASMLPSPSDGAATLVEPPTADPLDLTCASHLNNNDCDTGAPDKASLPHHQQQFQMQQQAFLQPQQQQQRGGGSSIPGQADNGSTTNNEEAHKCDMCGKTFAVPARLTRHYRTHTGERPFVCEVCGKSFSVKENLSVHRRIHTKEKPYRCTHCGRGFEHSGKLHRHMRIHTGERPHQCRDCGKTFIQSGQLVIHMRSHTGEKPYVCTVCGKGFTCSKQLKVHSRTHTGERPYACDICGKTFAYNHVLKLHQMAHLGERLYKCTLCSETFSSKKALEAHIKSHAVSPPRQSPVPSTSSSAASAASAPTLQSEEEVRRLASRSLLSGGAAVMENARQERLLIKTNQLSPPATTSPTEARQEAPFPQGLPLLNDRQYPMQPQMPWTMLNAMARDAVPRYQDEPASFAYPHYRERAGLMDPKSVQQHLLALQQQQKDGPGPPSLRPMPPLIPVSAAAVATLRSLHQRLGQQATNGESSGGQNAETRAGPPRKSSRFRDPESSESPPSSTSSSPPLLATEASDASLSDGTRAMSVIRFAHRSNGASPSHQPDCSA